MENLKTIIGLVLVFSGLGLFSFKHTYQYSLILGLALLILGIIILFTKRGFNTKGAGYSWHVASSEIKEDE